MVLPLRRGLLLHTLIAQIVCAENDLDQVRRNGRTGDAERAQR